MKAILEIKGHNVIITENENQIKVEILKDDEVLEEYSYEIEETDESSTEGSEDRFDSQGQSQSQDDEGQDGGEDEGQDDEDEIPYKESKSILGKSLQSFIKENKN